MSSVSKSQTVSWMTTPPKPSVNLLDTIGRIHKIGTEGNFFQRHLSASVQAVGAAVMAAFDTVSYTGTSAIEAAICMIVLDFPKAYGQMKANLGHALGSVRMVVVLVCVAAGGIFMPQTCFGSLPHPSKTEKQKDEAEPNTQASELQTKIQNLEQQVTQLTSASAATANRTPSADLLEQTRQTVSQLQEENAKLKTVIQKFEPKIGQYTHRSRRATMSGEFPEEIQIDINGEDNEFPLIDFSGARPRNTEELELDRLRQENQQLRKMLGQQVIEEIDRSKRIQERGGDGNALDDSSASATYAPSHDAGAIPRDGLPTPVQDLPILEEQARQLEQAIKGKTETLAALDGPIKNAEKQLYTLQTAAQSLRTENGLYVEKLRVNKSLLEKTMSDLKRAQEEMQQLLQQKQSLENTKVSKQRRRK